ncbi:MAG TPA: Rrf2 family transcriptional regulator [Candidatus Binatia bacterium]|jgi:Rrf2 family protein|nr:Rrf2 family transcriptional regulator [Candidatus Binatia bacterium]
MMSRKCKYALKALVRLGKEYGKGNLLTDDIARHEHIPKKFLELILLDLKRGGYVQSKQGAGGGYHLMQEPKKITLAEIYRFFDGAIALQPCVSQKFHEKCDDCPDEDTCNLKQAFSEVREKTYQIMSKITVESLLQDPRKAKSRVSR